MFKNTPESVTGTWGFAVTSYGNTGTTLPGTVQPDDGTLIGRLNTSDFVQNTDNANLDFRGANVIRAQPTRIMLTISNPDSPNGIQYLPYVFGQTC